MMMMARIVKIEWRAILDNLRNFFLWPGRNAQFLATAARSGLVRPVENLYAMAATVSKGSKTKMDA